jgi:hypothetical protein
MTNLGSAKLVVELKDGFLTVHHGQSGDLLVKKPADKDTWDTIFNSLSKG